jgi:NADH-quinone oxidoreductase subunit G
MLVDAAKFGDIEIPVFCYEPKLGQPVGACRMCLVEVEGIPKLQTACSTPVKDGMVVNTQTERVREAQQAVVEFLLINHPLDCPVCDKGGECPLQDITMGWGGGRSRFIEPKRHFQKPLALSPLIHIDRERCILCYRCVRFSQEVSEDYQLVLQERGAQTYVSTFDGHPYVAPFSGNITELCPVGALTSRPYRFRARPWDIQQSASICTLCPSQCNVSFTVRDERVLRVLARENEQVDDGWLCDKGRFAYQSAHVDERITQPMVRDGGELRPVTVGARDRGGRRRPAPRGRRDGRGRRGRDDQRGGLPPAAPRARRARLAARGLLPVRIPRARGARRAGRTGAAGHRRGPRVRARRPGARLRARRRRADPRPAPAQGRAPQPRQARGRLEPPELAGRQRGRVVRYAPGRGGEFAAAVQAALTGGDIAGRARAAGADADAVRGLADFLPAPAPTS